MNEPKVPDSDTDWRNIDIFLFSNGQHLTPPRKYHLASEELSRWNSTLTNLARAQYGSIISSTVYVHRRFYQIHASDTEPLLCGCLCSAVSFPLPSIDLYTIEGQRVLSPAELSNGNTYVAVPPRDTFLPAGYSEYLMRASRSREKRQNRSKSSTTQIDLQEDEEENEIPAIDIEAKEEIGHGETLNEEKNIAYSTADQAKTTPEVQPQFFAKGNNTMRQPERLTSNPLNSTIYRKQSSVSPPSMIRKPTTKSNETPVRKNFKLNTVKGANNGSTIITNNNNQSRTNSKLLNKTGKGINKENTLKNSTGRPKIINKVMSPIDETVTTDYMALANVIDDNELIIVKKQDSESKSGMYSELDKSGIFNASRQTRMSSMVPILIPIEESKVSAYRGLEETPVTVINNLIENVYKPDADVPNDTTSKNKNKLQIDDNIQVQQEDKINLNQKPPVDSFIAVIDKGDVVNLNLKIEVRKCEGAINEHDYSKPINFITENVTQVNTAEALPKSVDSNKLTINENNPKVVVIQCPCCQSHQLCDLIHKIDTASVKSDDKKCSVQLPDPQSDKGVERNQDIRNEQHSFDYNKERTYSIATPVKKVFATHSIHGLTASKTTQDDGVKELNVESNVANALEKSETQDTRDEHNSYDNKTRMSSSVCPAKRVFATHSIQRLTTISVTKQDIELTQLNVKSNDADAQEKSASVDNNPKTSSIQKIFQENSAVLTKIKENVQKTFVESSTQTEWTTMLVEARRHEDGRYSFYLPSLDVLKQCGF